MSNSANRAGMETEETPREVRRLVGVEVVRRTLRRKLERRSKGQAARNAKSFFPAMRRAEAEEESTDGSPGQHVKVHEEEHQKKGCGREEREGERSHSERQDGLGENTPASIAATGRRESVVEKGPCESAMLRR